LGAFLGGPGVEFDALLDLGFVVVYWGLSEEGDLVLAKQLYSLARSFELLE